MDIKIHTLKFHPPGPQNMILFFTKVIKLKLDH